MLIWVLLDQNIFLLNWFLIFKQLSKIYLDFILALRTKTVKNHYNLGLYFNFLLTLSRVKNQTYILSLLHSWLDLLLWLLTSFQWFLVPVPVLLQSFNQCSGLEVSISFLNFISQGAVSCVWVPLSRMVTSQLYSRGNQLFGNTIMLYCSFLPSLILGWMRLIILICLPLSQLMNFCNLSIC